jgi:hypothetical protein
MPRALAAAYAEAGQFLDAVQTARRAAKLADDAGRGALASAIRGVSICTKPAGLFVNCREVPPGDRRDSKRRLAPSPA